MRIQERLTRLDRAGNKTKAMAELVAHIYNSGRFFGRCSVEEAYEVILPVDGTKVRAHIDTTQILQIAKTVCAAAAVACPVINTMAGVPATPPAPMPENPSA